ncbi:MAG TPA: amidase [Prolixibacteraceae bacterium]|nr:amidase [Prolixibacteraceae bacterium]
MADLGDLLGSFMTGLIRARRMADEQTAALAEYYKSNPLLEGLSVPRIRIPELTIDMPFIIENHVEGEKGEMQDSKLIADAAISLVNEHFSKGEIKAIPNFHRAFEKEVENQLEIVKKSGLPIMKEAIVRGIQSAFSNTMTKTKMQLTTLQKDTIASALREKISSISVIKEQTPSSIVANIRTSDIKEQTSATSVVRLKITLKEEGLEWATQANDSGGVTRTLQPE